MSSPADSETNLTEDQWRALINAEDAGDIDADYVGFMQAFNEQSANVFKLETKLIKNQFRHPDQKKICQNMLTEATVSLQALIQQKKVFENYFQNRISSSFQNGDEHKSNQPPSASNGVGFIPWIQNSQLALKEVLREIKVPPYTPVLDLSKTSISQFIKRFEKHMAYCKVPANNFVAIFRKQVVDSFFREDLATNFFDKMSVVESENWQNLKIWLLKNRAGFNISNLEQALLAYRKIKFTGNIPAFNSEFRVLADAAEKDLDSQEIFLDYVNALQAFDMKYREIIDIAIQMETSTDVRFQKLVEVLNEQRPVKISIDKLQTKVFTFEFASNHAYQIWSASQSRAYVQKPRISFQNSSPAITSFKTMSNSPEIMAKSVVGKPAAQTVVSGLPAAPMAPLPSASAAKCPEHPNASHGWDKCYKNPKNAGTRPKTGIGTAIQGPRVVNQMIMVQEDSKENDADAESHQNDNGDTISTQSFASVGSDAHGGFDTGDPDADYELERRQANLQL